MFRSAEEGEPSGSPFGPSNSSPGSLEIVDLDNSVKSVTSSEQEVANVEEKTKDQLRKEFPLVFQPEKRQAMAVEERRPGMFAECKQFPSGLASCMWGCFHVRTPGARGTGFKGHMHIWLERKCWGTRHRTWLQIIGCLLTLWTFLGLVFWGLLSAAVQVRRADFLGINNEEFYSSDDTFIFIGDLGLGPRGAEELRSFWEQGLLGFDPAFGDRVPPVTGYFNLPQCAEPSIAQGGGSCAGNESVGIFPWAQAGMPLTNGQAVPAKCDPSTAGYDTTIECNFLSVEESQIAN